MPEVCQVEIHEITLFWHISRSRHSLSGLGVFCGVWGGISGCLGVFGGCCGGYIDEITIPSTYIGSKSNGFGLFSSIGPGSRSSHFPGGLGVFWGVQEGILGCIRVVRVYCGGYIDKIAIISSCNGLRKKRFSENPEKW
jgi:hypothetical protein